MAPARIVKAARPAHHKREKILHPDSRKASQLVRKQLRNGKLGAAASKRRKTYHDHVDVYSFFYHAIPDEGVSTLDELHTLVRDLWLTRHDQELEDEKAARRQGRPKSATELKLEEIRLRESETYRTGMEVPDLTHTANVDLFRKWDQKELAYIHLLRFIRISSVDPAVAVVSRPGKHSSLFTTNKSIDSQNGHDPDMDVDLLEKPGLA